MDRPAIVPAFITRLALGVIGLLTVAVLLLTVFNDKGMLKVHEQALQLEGLNKENADLSAENTRLIQEIQDLSSDPATIERRAREKLKLVRPGEIILITPEAPETPETSTTPTK